MKSKPAMIVFDKSDDCRNCPMNLRCLAGSRLNYYDDTTDLYNPLGASACTRCQAVHFMVDNQCYVCTNIRDGMHPRKHPMYPVWDSASANMAEIYAMGAVADDVGGNQNPLPSHTCILQEADKSDCASMWRHYNNTNYDDRVMHADGSTSPITITFKDTDSGSNS